MDPKQLSLRGESTDPRRAFRARRGDVRLAVLSILKRGPATGYGIMQAIDQRSKGVWRVSSGSVYPNLDSLSSEGLISSSYQGGTSTYNITPNGMRYIDARALEEARIWNFSEPEVSENFGPLETELARLSEAIQLASRTNSKVVDRIYLDVIDFRKKIFRYLSE